MLVPHTFQCRSGKPILSTLEWKKDKKDDVVDIANEIDEYMRGRYITLTFDNKEIELINVKTNKCVTFRPGMMGLRWKYEPDKTLGFMVNEMVYSNYVEVPYVEEDR